MKITTLLALGSLAALALLAPLATAAPICQGRSFAHEDLVKIESTTCVAPEGDGDHLVYGVNDVEVASKGFTHSHYVG